MSLKVTKPGFSFFMCLFCVVVHFFSFDWQMCAYVALDLVFSVFSIPNKETGFRKRSEMTYFV